MLRPKFLFNMLLFCSENLVLRMSVCVCFFFQVEETIVDYWVFLPVYLNRNLESPERINIEIYNKYYGGLDHK